MNRPGVLIVMITMCGCSGPVDVVEDWYAAMVRGDERVAREALCHEVADQIPAGALTQMGGIKRVIRSIDLQQRDDHYAQVAMLDAAGASTLISLRHDANRWCIAGGP
jgi:hypothetical protein